MMSSKVKEHQILPGALTSALLLLVLLLTGCVHAPAPYVPTDWEHGEIEATLTDKSGQPRLYVLIMYSGNTCGHTALRLFAPDRGVLFWDPAGGYAIQGSVKAKRVYDLIFDKTPTLAEYLAFRKEIPTSATEIFEWKISDKIADELYDLLITSNRKNPDHIFNTQGTGLFCGSIVSEFLNRFAADIIPVEKVFYPHDLAKQLYALSPERVLVVRGDNITQYLPHDLPLREKTRLTTKD